MVTTSGSLLRRDWTSEHKHCPGNEIEPDFGEPHKQDVFKENQTIHWNYFMAILILSIAP